MVQKRKIKFGEGGETGMQTKVWGPAGWIFLHSIVQNYPWNPTPQQKIYYRRFLSDVGQVLPCRYCRESYQKFAEDLNDKALQNRKTLTKWLYNLHNKVNKKLGIPKSQWPSFDAVWRRYESYRASCKKTPENEKKKGCITPYSGSKKKCVVKIISAEKKPPVTQTSEFGMRPKIFKRTVKNVAKIPKRLFAPIKLKQDVKIIDNLIGKTSREISGRKELITESKRQISNIIGMKKNTGPFRMEDYYELDQTQKRLNNYINNQTKLIEQLEGIKKSLRERKRLTNIQRAVYKRDSLKDRLTGKSYEVKLK